MPQLDTTWFASQIFWLIIAFVTLYWLLSRKALPRLAEILEARQDRIAADLDEAERLRQEAEEALASYQQAIARAQDEAHRLLTETQIRLQATAAERQAELDAELGKQLREAERASPRPGSAALENSRRPRSAPRRRRSSDWPASECLQGRAAQRSMPGARGRLMLELWLLIALIILIATVSGSPAHADHLWGARRPRRQGPGRARRGEAPARGGAEPARQQQRQLVSGEDQARRSSSRRRPRCERQAERHRVELEASLQRRTERRSTGSRERRRGLCRTCVRKGDARDPHHRAPAGRPA